MAAKFQNYISIYSFLIYKKSNLTHTNCLKMIILLLILTFSCEENQITLTVKKTGSKTSIFYENFFYLPSSIKVEDQEVTLDYYNRLTLDSTLATVELFWDYFFTNCIYMFCGVESIVSIDFSKFNSSGINDMCMMFSSCTQLEYINFGNFDTSSVTDMFGLFYDTPKLTELDLSSFDVSKVTDMQHMFRKTGINNINLNNFNTSSLVLMNYMFAENNNLTSIDLSMLDTSRVTDMYSLFYYCEKLETINLSNLDNPVLTDISWMFANCFNLNYVNLTGFHTRNVENMTDVFDNCISLVFIDISSFDTKNVIDMNDFFYGCINLTSIKFGKFNTNAVQNFEEFFLYCYSLTSLDLSFLNTTNAILMGYMFGYCKNLQYINIQNFDTKNVIDMSYMFSGCYSLSSLNLSNFDTSKVLDFTGMFWKCYNLETLILSEFKNTIAYEFIAVFQGCEKLKYLDLSKFYTPNATYMYYMFQDCESLESLDLSTFNTSRVKDMDSMFLNCKSLTSLNLSNFDTSQMTCMDNMFANCSNLELIDFRNIKINSFCTFDNFLSNCSNLKYLNIFSINDEYESFYDELNYYKDTDINITLCINNETIIPHTFQIFKSLINSKRDCSNKCYPTSKLYLPNEFLCIDDCRTYNLLEYNSECISSCPEGMLISPENKCFKLNCDKYYNYNKTECLEEIPNGYYLNDTKEKTIDKCDSDCEKCDKKGTMNNSNCISCNNPKILKEGNCVNFCDKGDFMDKDGIKKCKCEKEKCLSCSKESLSQELCITCNEDKGYYPKLADIIKNDTFINCYNNLDKYFLKENRYEPCYNSCQTCDKSGDDSSHNCKICDSDFPYIIEYNEGNFNCYKNCTFYHYFDFDKNKYFCSVEEKCTGKYDKLILEKNECIDNCSKDNEYIYEFQNRCYKQNPNTEKIYTTEFNKIYTTQFSTSFYKNFNYISNTEFNNIKLVCTKEFPFEHTKTHQCVSNCNINEFQDNLCLVNFISNETNDRAEDEMVNNIQQGLTNGYNTSDIDEGKDVTIEQENSKSKVTISSTGNQKNIEKEKNNITSINLGECENMLKAHYGIPKDKNLYILKIEVPQEGLKTIKMEYEVYYPLNGENLVKLNLSVCRNSKVDISIPIILNEDLDKLNTSSRYFNDLCYTYTSEKGTDMILKDRQKEYVESNKTICEENCRFADYNYDIEKAVCSCEIKIKLPLISEIRVDTNKLYDSFTNVKVFANLNVMGCYKLFFSFEGISYNFGCYILIPIFIFHIVSTILFYCRDYKKNEIYIRDIIFAKKNWNSLNKLFNKETKKIKKDKINLLPTINKKQKSKNKKKKKAKKNDIKIINEIKINKSSQKEKEFKKEEENESQKGEDKEDKKEENKKVEEENEKEEKNQNEMQRPIIIERPLYVQYLQIIHNIYKGKKKEPHSPTKKEKNINIIKSNKKNKRRSLTTSENKSHNNLQNNSASLLKKRKDYEFCKQVFSLTDYEMNCMIYEDALKNDHRTYCSYYLSLLRQKDLIIFSFFPMNDYNSRIMKIDFFFINFATYYAINALFFNDSTIHKIHQDDGDYNFIYQLPQIIYSSFISGVINIFLKTIALTGINIVELKQSKNMIEAKADKTKKLIANKLISYFIISYILLLLFWYYIGCFCAIYKNTQIHLIKDSIISFGLSFIYPLFIYLLPGMFRIPALKNEKNKRELMYQFSKIIQFF